MRLYWEVARRGFSRYASYRAATLAGLFTNIMFGFMRGYVLLAVLRTRPEVGGFDATDTITYVFLTQGMLAVIMLWGYSEVAMRVRTGDIATDLTRPLDVEGWYLSQDLGRAAYHLFSRGIPPFLVGAAFFALRLPEHAVTVVVFGASLFLAVCVSFALRFLANLTAFWLLDSRGVSAAYGLTANLLSGFLVPVAFFPGWLETLARASPFPSMIQVPIEVFLEKTTGVDVLGVLAMQAFWALALLGLGRWTLAAATRRLVVQGG